MFWIKLKAGALQLTLFIAIVIAILLTAFILLVHTHKKFNIQTDFIIETTENANKGISYSLTNGVLLNDTITINLEDEDYKSLKVQREFWGVFEKVISISKIKSNTLKKVALIGGIQPKQDRVALYLQDNNKPLVLVRDTKIKGLTYLPKQGVKPGTISGEFYYGSKLIYGTSRIAQNLPKFFNESNTQFRAVEIAFSKANEEQFLNIEANKTYKNSFFESTKFMFSNSQIYLNNVSIIGNIIIQSKTKIMVDPTAVLKDVILVAPEIEIQNNVKGNFQAIASKSIVIGERVELNYPSALVINKNESAQTIQNGNVTKRNGIIVNYNSTIKGMIVYVSASENNNFKTQVELKEKASLIGEIYCNQNLELKGIVHGSVFTNNFVANQSGSVYQNHIYNGTIIVDELPQEYVGLMLENSKKRIVKWLY